MQGRNSLGDLRYETGPDNDQLYWALTRIQVRPRQEKVETWVFQNVVLAGQGTEERDWEEGPDAGQSGSR